MDLSSLAAGRQRTYITVVVEWALWAPYYSGGFQRRKNDFLYPQSEGAYCGESTTTPYRRPYT